MNTQQRKPIAAMSLCACMVVPGLSLGALIDRGGGLIYDDVLDVTWLQDANFASSSGFDADGLMTWYAATSWTDNLSYYDSVRGVTYSDWRLPQILPVNGVSYDYTGAVNGSSDVGYNITSPNNELSYMFYVNLGNPGYYSISGVNTNCQNVGVIGTCLDNTGPFYNLQSASYWTGADSSLHGAGYAWYLYLQNGFHDVVNKNTSTVYSWAVRDGDVTAATSTVPTPAAAWLFCSGLLGLIGVAKRKKAA